MGQDGLGAAQQQHEAGQRGKADDGQHHTNGQRREKLVEANRVAALVFLLPRLRLMMVPEPWPSVKPRA